MKGYDNWKLQCGREGERVFSHCIECGQEIYVGEEYYQLKNGDSSELLHEDCIDSYSKGNLFSKEIAE